MVELSRDGDQLSSPGRSFGPRVNSLAASWRARAGAGAAPWESLPLFLEELAAALSGSGHPGPLAQARLAERVAHENASAEDVLREFSVLREVLFDFFEEKEPLGRAARAKLLAFFDELAWGAAAAFRGRAQTRFAREHHKFHQVFDLSPAIMALWRGPELIFEEINPIYRSITGDRDLVGKPLLEAMPEMRDQPFAAIIRGVFETGEPFVAREMIAKIGEGSAGQDHYFNFTFLRVLDEAGRPYGVFNHAVDVTDHVRARLAAEKSQLALKHTQEQLHLALESAKMGTWSIDLRTHYVTTSPTFARIFGVSDVQGDIFAEIDRYMHPEDRAEVNRVWTRAVEQDLLYEHEYRIIWPDGSVRWVLSRGTVKKAPDGTPEYFSGVLSDTTERKEAEIKLARAVAIARIGFFDWDIPRDSFTFSGKFRELWSLESGVDLAALTARVADEDRERVRAGLEKTIRGEGPFHETFRLESAEGGSCWVESRGEVQADEAGRPLKLFGTTVDVTERVREREIRERFVSALTHDLRTPMTSARMTAQLVLRKNPGNDSVSQASSRIVASMDRADQMIRDLLDANRLKAGEGVPITREAFCLNELLREVVSELQHVHNERIELELRAPDQVCGEWDRQAIRRIVENLVGNAVKYGFAQRPISVSLTTGEGTVTLRVHNFGPAISPEDQRTLFQPFRRTASALAGTQRGWGIGLSLVKGLAQAQGGVVDVDSAPGRGTTFCVELPWTFEAGGPVGSA